MSPIFVEIKIFLQNYFVEPIIFVNLKLIFMESKTNHRIQ